MRFVTAGFEHTRNATLHNETVMLQGMLRNELGRLFPSSHRNKNPIFPNKSKLIYAARMKRPDNFILRLILSFLFLAALTPLDAQDDSKWQAGIAKVPITPDESIWMSGYASRDRPAEGTRTEIWAKALALEDGEGKKAVLITLDLVGIHRDISLRICDAIMEAHGIGRSRIVINTSHTHTGPVVGNNLRTMYFLSDEEAAKVDRYTASLPGKIAGVAAEAFRNLVPAKLSFAEGQATFGTNRRNNPESQVPELRASGKLNGPADYGVPVLRIANEDGAPLGVVFGYACHATTLSDYQWSGDYPGYAQTALEAQLPGVTALFWAGCGADINPIPRRKPELAERYGRDLADAVNRALNGVFTELDPTIECNYAEIDLPFDKLPSREKLVKDSSDENKYIAARAKMLLKKLDQGEKLSPVYPYPISAWNLGKRLNFIALGGEVVVDYSLRLKRELGPNTWVAGYSHDIMAYIPSARVWREGGYEGATAMIYYGLPSRWAGNVEDLILSEVRRQVETVSGVR